MTTTNRYTNIKNLEQIVPYIAQKGHFDMKWPSCDAYRIQTYDLLIRSQMLYSAELRRRYITS